MSFSGGSGYVVETLTRSATIAPVASSTDAFSPVPPMSIARVKGFAGAVCPSGMLSPLRHDTSSDRRRALRQWSDRPVGATRPTVEVHHRIERCALAPAVALEVRHFLQPF